VFFGAKDVSCKNLCISAASQLTALENYEVLFTEKDVLYAGQPVGVIIAETHNLAIEAAKLVEIKYTKTLRRKSVISIKDALATNNDTRFMQRVNVPAKQKGKSYYISSN